MSSVSDNISRPTAALATLDTYLNFQRRAALVAGGAIDHAGKVQILPKANFDMGRTIFGKMQGTIPRIVMQDKLAKDVFWNESALSNIEAQYHKSCLNKTWPAIDQDIVQFISEECDFSMEHADGTFLEHLAFCYAYSTWYYPKFSANVAFLHSILGTATNTFAMSVDKLPKLKERLTAFEVHHIELFPSILRLLYDGKLIPELRKNIDRLDNLSALRCHRVIDNQTITTSAEDLWINLNYHLMHFVDFMPTANWAAHLDDPLMQQFIELSSFLDDTNRRQAEVHIQFPTHFSRPVGEVTTITRHFVRRIPSSIKRALARNTVRKYSEKINHSLEFHLEFTH